MEQTTKMTMTKKFISLKIFIEIVRKLVFDTQFEFFFAPLKSPKQWIYGRYLEHETEANSNKNQNNILSFLCQ